MKIKQTPEDFQVEELMDLPETADGAYGVYRLEKRGIGTIEAVEALCRARRISLSAIAYGGLKDRHAFTSQQLTIEGRYLAEQNFAQFRLIPLGRTDRPARASLSRGNRFVIVVRDLSAAECGAVAQRAETVRAQGVPNYFDDQRFGSFHPGVTPFGRLLIERRYEEALREYLTRESPGDGRRARHVKRTIDAGWGRWEALFRELPRGSERGIVGYLKSHPHRFAGALDRLRSPLKSLQLYAYQSALWNAVLADVIRDAVGADAVDELTGRAGPLRFADRFPPDVLQRLAAMAIPMPHTRAEPAQDVRAAYAAVLEREGLRPEDLKIRKLRHIYLKKGERPALAPVADLEVDAPGADAHNDGRFALRMRVSLPPGSYATIVIKDLTRSFWRGPKRARRRIIRSRSG